MTDGNNVKVLIVEDELIVALNLSKELEALGFEVTGMAATEAEAVSLANETCPQVILMDINLAPGGSGLSAAKKINAAHTIPIIYVTAYSSDKIIKLAGKTNPYGYILKPYNAREVKAVINTALIRFKYENKIIESEQRLKVAMHAAELDVLEFNHSNHSVSIAEKTSKFHELGFEQTMSKHDFLELFVSRDAKLLDDLLSLRKPFNRRARLKAQKKNSNANQYLDVYLSNIFFHNNSVQIGAVQDVTDQQHSIADLKISHSVLKQMQESVVVLDEDELIQKTNPAFAQLLGYSEQEIINKPIGLFLLRERKDDTSVVKLTRLKGNGKRQSEVTVKCKDGTLVHAMMTVSKLQRFGDIKQVVVTLTDISRLVEAERRLHKIAFTDALTGFGNRGYFNRLLAEMAESSSNQNVALFFIDLDGFKKINDSLGHEFGDKVLIEFSSRVRSVFRDEDHLVRIGGDEFVAVLTGTFEKENLQHIGEKILKLFVTDFLIDGLAISISCSVGIALSSANEFQPDVLLKQADSAMYHAKKAGKNTFRFFDEALAEQTQYRIFIEQGLRSAIKNDQITVYLQAIVNQQGRITSVESLCRWFDPKIGFIPPAVFIPVAEENQLIQTLGLKIINESMIAKKQLNEAGYPHIILNINFSEKQLQNSNTYTVVCELLESYELNANEFVIEITESILQGTSSTQTINLLRRKGFKFAIDDFGTGYSSLSKLHDYNVDVVKIDKSFVDLLCSNTKQNIITQAIIDLGQKLGYKVVAEGVENEQQRKILIEMGCDSLQGYLFAKPMPIHELLRHLK